MKSANRFVWSWVTQSRRWPWTTPFTDLRILAMNESQWRQNCVDKRLKGALLLTLDAFKYWQATFHSQEELNGKLSWLVRENGVSLTCPRNNSAIAKTPFMFLCFRDVLKCEHPTFTAVWIFPAKIGTSFSINIFESEADQHLSQNPGCNYHIALNAKFVKI